MWTLLLLLLIFFMKKLRTEVTGQETKLTLHPRIVSTATSIPAVKLQTSTFQNCLLFYLFS
jgi:hypothetical protein